MELDLEAEQSDAARTVTTFLSHESQQCHIHIAWAWRVNTKTT
jgi:hypothetical protein